MFVCISIVSNISFPTVSYALTGGPSAPEYTSFEPLDITDMVNVATGDFTYSIPLLEVPGPEGSYPVSLFYHGGIMPEEEATWVGLGWNLNVGAVNRTVNMYADDLKGGSYTMLDDWLGGESNSVSVGVGWGIGVASVGVGVTVASDTYKGFGVGWNLSAGAGFGKEGKMGVGGDVGVGVGPYGGGYVSASIGVSTPGEGITGSASLSVVHSFDDGSTSFSAGVSADVTYKRKNPANGKHHSLNLLGASISSHGLSPSVSPAGLSASQVNTNAGNVTINTSSFGITIPIPTEVGIFTIDLGFSHTRYYLHQMDNQHVYGALYPSHAVSELEIGNNGSSIVANDNKTTFDAYAMIDPYVDNPLESNPDHDFGGSMPAYDSYSVVAQGLSGSMQPYILENGNIYRQNTTFKDTDDDGNTIYQYETKFTNPSAGDNNYDATNAGFTMSPGFRFINDFSNSFTRDMPLPSGAPSMNTLYGSAVDAYSAIDKNGVSLASAEAQPSQTPGYNPSTKRLAGSKHIEWFTNRDIMARSAKAKGFVAYDDLLEHRDGSFQTTDGTFYDVRDQIGGFMITNESGVTYHYSLPVYAFEDYSLTCTDCEETEYKRYISESWHIQPYAYTWLLTGITGPDYVDRGNDGMDADDWGYFVKFDYGKWTDQYIWRNPTNADGNHKRDVDLDSEQEHFSTGRREMYYLDAISTRTHTAIFVKDIRTDGKGVSSRVNGGFSINEYKSGGDLPAWVASFAASGKQPVAYTYNAKNAVFQGLPAASLRLDRIMLFTNQALTDGVNCCVDENISYRYLKKRSTIQNIANDLNAVITDDGTSTNNVQFLNTFSGLNLLLGTNATGATKYKYAAQQTFTAPHKIRYHNADNVIDVKDVQDIMGQLQSVAIKEIKLNQDYSLCQNTDNSLAMNYPNNVSVANLESRTESSFYNASDFNSTTNKPVKKGKLTLKSIDFYGTAGTKSVPPLEFAYANNPDYNTDKYDMWGYYKSDHTPTSEKDRQSYARRTSVASKNYTDAWSLTKITTSLGAEISIDYESDSYSNVALYNSNNISFKDFNYQNVSGSKYVLASPWDYEQLNNIITSGSMNLSVLYECIIADFPDFKPKIKTLSFNNLILGADFTITASNQVKITHAGVVNLFTEVTQQDGDDVLFSQIMFANAVTAKNQLEYGGGVRVASVSVDNKEGTVKKTRYIYENATSGTSFGTLVYEPEDVNVNFVATYNTGPYDAFKDDDEGVEKLYKDSKNNYKKQFFKGINTSQNKTIPMAEVIANRQFLPSPNVVYSKVIVQDEINNLPATSRMELEFTTMDDYAIFPVRERLLNGNISTGNGYKVGYIKLRNFNSRLGMLKSKKTYGKNNQLLYETSTHYLQERTGTMSFDNYETNLSNFISKQGRVDQLFHEWRIKYYGVTNHDDKQAQRQMMITEIEDYPAVPVSTTSTDYKTGITTLSENLGFDFYTGSANAVKSSDAYGNTFISYTVAAYEKYGGMGLKVNNINNANMLTQTAASYMFRVPGGYVYNPSTLFSSALGLVGASVQTWSTGINIAAENDKVYAATSVPLYVEPDGSVGSSASFTGAQSKIWRSKSSYTWVGNGDAANVNNDGTYKPAAFTDFNFSEGAVNNNWLYGGEITLYDVYSHALEGKDMNNLYATTIMSPNYTKGPAKQFVLASASNARKGEAAYCGAEFFVEGNSQLMEGGVNIGAAEIFSTGTNVHTGSYSLYVKGGKEGFNYTIPTEAMQKDAAGKPMKSYSAAVWVYLPGSSEGDGTQATLNLVAELYARVEGATSDLAVAHPVAGRKAGSWYLISLDNVKPEKDKDLKFGVRAKKIATYDDRGGYFDDFRVYPTQGSMAAYVYDKTFSRVTHILDADNLYAAFEYCNTGRVIRNYRELISDDGIKDRVVSLSEINYKRFSQAENTVCK